MNNTISHSKQPIKQQPSNSKAAKKSRTCYGYRPLATGEEFRLLKLFPASSLRADIHCRLFHYSVDQAPQYECLSYTWGDDKRMQRITVDGLSFYIRRNLLAALQHLRQAKDARLIWIDAICINQEDNGERAAQVLMMRQIYSTGRRTMVWLGESSSDSDMAIDFIPYLTLIAKLDIPFLWFTLLAKDEFLRKIISIADLFFRKWWHRTWIIQEVGLSTDVLMLCGKKQIPWFIIHRFVITWMDITFAPYIGTLYQPEITRLQAIALRYIGMAISSCSEALTRAWSLCLKSKPSLLSFKLLHLLWSFKYHEVTDPKDKIYGLLGFTRSSDCIKVDYNPDVCPEELYISTLCSFLIEDTGLDVFRWMTGEIREPDNLNLPSWVPNFGARTVMPISSFIGDSTDRSQELKRTFLTAGADRSRSRLSIEFEDDNRVLVLKGCEVDVICNLAEVCPCMDSMIFDQTALYPVIKHWQHMAETASTAPYTTGPAKQEAFWRSILTDRKLEGFHFPDNAGWFPAKRLESSEMCVPPANSGELKRLVRGIECRSHYVYGRRFGLSKRGFFSLLPEKARVGDMICVLLGGEVPYVLRAVENDPDHKYYTMVGEW